MPNTLAHLGVQALVGRAVVRGGDVKWIWAACVIPDLPWILQRAARTVLPSLDAYDVRLYAIAQSTLAVSLLLAGALSLLTARPRRVFAILAMGCVLHLLLDATQTKWANGVHLFAPLSWELLNWGLFWPEDRATLALTALGVAYAGFAAVTIREDLGDLVRPRGIRLAALTVLVALYLALPAALMPRVMAADNHFVRTLSDVAERPGRTVEFDRNAVVIEDGRPSLRAWTGERHPLAGAAPAEAGTVSVRGRFLDGSAVDVLAWHAHPPGVRDAASTAGLAVVLAWWDRLRGALGPEAQSVVRPRMILSISKVRMRRLEAKMTISPIRPSATIWTPSTSISTAKTSAGRSASGSPNTNREMTR
jgi:hypothetical protein